MNSIGAAAPLNGPARFAATYDAIMLICKPCLRLIHYLPEQRDCFLYFTSAWFVCMPWSTRDQQTSLRWKKDFLRDAPPCARVILSGQRCHFKKIVFKCTLKKKEEVITKAAFLFYDIEHTYIGHHTKVRA